MNKNSNIKIGFVFHPGSWVGGRNYLRNLFSAIRALPRNDITPIVFTGTQEENLSVDFSRVNIVRTSMLDSKSPAWFARKLISKCISQDRFLRRLLHDYDVSILSHSGHLGRQFFSLFSSSRKKSIATIGWIPDFQHIYLPELFSAEEICQRNRHFIDLCRNCDRVIVSSKCAQSDMQSFAPQYANKAEVLQFVASPSPIHNAASLSDLEQLYGFEQPYFLLPNQFWAHKNHRVVIRALQILKQQNKLTTILATGVTDDYRQPTFFASLMKYAKECNVLDLFRVLGSIPFDHLVGLMRYSIAFINPSLFEGWSTSVEEAKSMGKQILLSDIPVHREQAPKRSIFFQPDDSDALAAAILETQNGFDENQDAAMQEIARYEFAGRQIQFGEAYSRIVTDLF